MINDALEDLEDRGASDYANEVREKVSVQCLSIFHLLSAYVRWFCVLAASATGGCRRRSSQTGDNARTERHNWGKNADSAACVPCGSYA